MLESSIPDDAVMFNGSNYKIFDDIMTWYEANEFAESLGGHLATITSNEEQQFLPC